ncbi:MAG: type IX secretion system membrane protein PorP/SprF, partial [Bacteroidota bacterium]
MRRLILSLPLLIFALSLSAQDKHFTQFYSAPLTLNPALTGAFDGRYRVSAIYRDQWRGALDEPYVTFASAIDVKFDLELSNRYEDAVAIGLLFFSDRVNGIDFNTNQIALSGA